MVWQNNIGYWARAESRQQAVRESDGFAERQKEVKGLHECQGNILAHGTSTLMVMPGKGIRVGAKKFLDQ